MKILDIDTRTETSELDKDTMRIVKKKRKPTFNLIVEMTQEEYQLVALYLELDKRNKLKTKVELPKLNIDKLLEKMR